MMVPSLIADITTLICGHKLPPRARVWEVQVTDPLNLNNDRDNNNQCKKVVKSNSDNQLGQRECPTYLSKVRIEAQSTLPKVAS